MMTFSLKLNDEKKYKLTCNGSKIEFQIKNNMGSFYRIFITPKSGEFDFFSDSLTIIVPEGHEINYYKFVYDKKEISGHQLIQKGKTLVCHFNERGTYNSPNEFRMLIPPGNFILCNGKPLVTDTIRITLKK